MKRTLIIAVVCLGAAIAACNKEKSDKSVTPTPQVRTSATPNAHYASKTTDDTSGNSIFISKDAANQMISSYIYSTNSTSETDTKSFSVNADSLRAYLADGNIKNVKLIFAHTSEYMNAGNTGLYCGTQAGAITIVIAAYNASGDFVYHNGCVLDHVLPCPSSCPPGQAGNDLLQ